MSAIFKCLMRRPENAAPSARLRAPSRFPPRFPPRFPAHASARVWRLRAPLLAALVGALLALMIPSMLPGNRSLAQSEQPAVGVAAGSAGGNLTLHGGPVQHRPVAYLIFYGPTWNSGGALSADGQVVLRFFADVGYSAYANVVRQYSDANGGISSGITLGAYYLDPTSPPTDTSCGGATLEDAQIQAEAQRVISAGHWPTDGVNATYFVFAPSSVAVNDGSGACSERQFCTYHNWSASLGVAYAAIPYPTDHVACGSPNSPNSNADGDSLVNLSAYALFEAITDPRITSGWLDGAGEGIGGKCEWNFSGGLTSLNNQGVFSAQALYSNAVSACASSFVKGPGRAQAIGVYRPSSGVFYLRDTTTTGSADTVAAYSPQGCQPLSGDWTGKGYDSIGVYCGSTGVFYLRNSNTSGSADITFAFGPINAGCQAIAGDWTGAGYDSVGLDCGGIFYLKSSYAKSRTMIGPADLKFAFGPASGCTPVAGDWNGKGFDSVGVYCGATFYLRNSNTAGVGDLAVAFGPSGCAPVVGDWTGKGYDSLGVACAGAFYLRNSNTSGSADITLLFGAAGDIPLAGTWT